jgi:hypothetical protein
MEGGYLYFDDDNDTYIESGNDDTLQFHTSGSVRVNINNSNALFNVDISMLPNYDIKPNGNDIIFTTGGRINFYDQYTSASAGAASALPSNPTGYFAVEYRGSTRKIPYYS